MTYALGVALAVALLAAMRYRLAVSAAEGEAGAERVRRERAEAEAERVRLENVALRDSNQRLTRAHDVMAGKLADAERRAAEAIRPGEGAAALRGAFP